MLNRRQTLLVATLCGAALAMPVRAAETAPYSAQAFDAAQKAGRSILVEVHGAWCQVCKAQASIIADISKANNFKNLVVFHVDFDAQKDALKRLKVQTQGTLITYKGLQETGRSVGDTRPESITGLAAKAL